MPHKPWKLLLSFWATSLALVIVTLLTLVADSNAQETLEPHACYEFWEGDQYVEKRPRD